MSDRSSFVASGETLIARLLAQMLMLANDLHNRHRPHFGVPLDQCAAVQCRAVKALAEEAADSLSSPREGAVILTPPREEKEQDETRGGSQR